MKVPQTPAANDTCFRQANDVAVGSNPAPHTLTARDEQVNLWRV